MARHKSLTTSAIAAAALTIVDRDGLALLSMRTVAGELGVGTMSLYRYVDSRVMLEDLVLDAVLGGIRTEVPERMSWEKRIFTLVERVRMVIQRHPAIVPLLLTHRQGTMTSLRWGEAVMSALALGGFDGGRRVIAFRTVLSYVIGAVQVEHFGPLSGEGTAALAALPAEEYPFVSQTAAAARRIGSDREFREGLEIVLRGLRSSTRRRARRPLR